MAGSLIGSTCLLLAGCVSLGESTPSPVVSTPSPTLQATPSLTPSPARTPRPCASGDTRPRCQTPGLPTATPSTPPTETPAVPPTEPPTATPPAPPTTPPGIQGGDLYLTPSVIDFGNVDVGSTATGPVTITNTGVDPFGPINMFGGAPPTPEFNASQNCQGTTLAPGGTCGLTYEFTPGTDRLYTDTSSFTISETANQSDGFDFSVVLQGCGNSSPFAFGCLAPPVVHP